MDICEGKRGIVHLEPDRDSSFVSGHTREASLDVELSDSLHGVPKLFLNEHRDEAADHQLLGNRDEPHPFRVLAQRAAYDVLPDSRPFFVLPFHYLACCQVYHLLQSHDVDV